MLFDYPDNLQVSKQAGKLGCVKDICENVQIQGKLLNRGRRRKGESGFHVDITPGSRL